MQQVLQLVVVFFAALATGGLMVNWIGLGRAMSRLSVSTYVEFHQAAQHVRPLHADRGCGASLGGIVLAFLSPGIHSLSGELAIAGSSLLCRSPGDCLVHKRPDQQTDRVLVSSDPAR
jgi:hypothetical protein